MLTLLHLGVLTATVLGLAKFLPGVRVGRTTTAIVTAVVFSLLNWALGWVIGALLFLPALLTLGLLFLFVPFIVNTIVLWLTDKFLGDFEIKDAKTLLISSGVITLVSALFHWIVRN